MNKPDEQFSFKFPKTERLSSKIEIDELFQSGLVTKQFPFRILNIPHSGPQSNPFPKILISVPKKRHKKAVTRNLIKRRIREAYRLLKPQLEHELRQQKAIGIIYVSNRTEAFNLISDKLILALKRLPKNKN